MEALLGFHVGFWDYVTFGAIAVIVTAFLALAFFILGLPGRIAIARNHPEADAIYLMGWIGFLAVVPARANAGALMNRRATAFVIAAAALVGLGVASAQAAPCTSQIAQ